MRAAVCVGWGVGGLKLGLSGNAIDIEGASEWLVSERPVSATGRVLDGVGREGRDGGETEVKAGPVHCH